MAGSEILVKLYFYDKEKAYVENNQYINWQDERIKECAASVIKEEWEEVKIVQKLYEFVRDEIHHSWDYKDKTVTASATQVLECRTGICWAKSNLLAALLRAVGIPCGICYQKLTLGDTPDTGYCIHALNAVYMKSLNRWIRLDARGNNENVKAEFHLQEERLGFSVRPEMGERDYGIVYAAPSEKLMGILENSADAVDMYLHSLPDTIFELKRAGMEDMDALVSTRIEVLRAANQLSDDTDMSKVEKESKNYYEKALPEGLHTAYLVYDKARIVGAGGVSFYSVMPTYHNPTGEKAYIMNMFTNPNYRRKGIAMDVLDLLVKEAKSRGVKQITLEATQLGRPLYEKYGFVKMQNEMELSQLN